MKFFAGTCSALSLSNGQVSYNTSTVNGGYPVDTKASFTCNSGHSGSGSGFTICQNSGDWDQQTPGCNQSKYLTLVQLHTRSVCILLNIKILCRLSIPWYVCIPI